MTKEGNDDPDVKMCLANVYPNSIVGLVIWEKAASLFTGISFANPRYLQTAILPRTYHNSAVSTWAIGNILAYVNSAICSGIDSDLCTDTYCIGHSLGAHLCGFYGKMMRQLKLKVQKILALDPAGPIFDDHKGEYKLQPSDANFVEVWHTSTIRLGHRKTLGHVDIYINGGYIQPNCGLGFGLLADKSHKFAYLILKQIIELNNRPCGCVAEWLCIPPTPGVELWNALKNVKGEDEKKLNAAGCTRAHTDEQKHKEFQLGQLIRTSTPDNMRHDVYWVEVTPNSRTCPENSESIFHCCLSLQVYLL